MHGKCTINLTITATDRGTIVEGPMIGNGSPLFSLLMQTMTDFINIAAAMYSDQTEFQKLIECKSMQEYAYKYVLPQLVARDPSFEERLAAEAFVETLKGLMGGDAPKSLADFLQSLQSDEDDAPSPDPQDTPSANTDDIPPEFRDLNLGG